MSEPILSVTPVYSPRKDWPSSALREPSLSSAVFSFLAATAAASPVKSVCLEAVVFPASGEIDVSGVSYTILFGEIPVVSQTSLRSL